MSECVIIPLTVELYETPADTEGKPVKQPDGTTKKFSCQNYVIAQVDGEKEIHLTAPALMHFHYTDSVLNCMRVQLIREVDCASCKSASGRYDHDLGRKGSGSIVPPGKYQVLIPEQSYVDLCGQEPREMDVEIIFESVSDSFLLAYKCGG